MTQVRWGAVWMFVAAAILAGAATPAQRPSAPHVVFVTGDDEYRSESSMPMIAAILERQGIRTSVARAVPRPQVRDNIEGLEALAKDGTVLGRVDHFRSTPAGSVVVIQGEREHWVPFVRDRIVSVDLAVGRIVFDWAADW